MNNEMGQPLAPGAGMPGAGMPSAAGMPDPAAVLQATPVATIYAWADPAAGTLRFLGLPLSPSVGGLPTGAPVDLGTNWGAFPMPSWAAPLRASAADSPLPLTGIDRGGLEMEQGVPEARPLQGGYFVHLDDATIANVEQIARHVSAALRRDVSPQEVVDRQFRELYAQHATVAGEQAQYEQALALFRSMAPESQRAAPPSSSGRVTAAPAVNAQQQANRNVKAQGAKTGQARPQAAGKANAQAAGPPAATAPRSHRAQAGQNSRNGAGATPQASGTATTAPINETNSAPAETRELANV